ncbi:MAG: UDP-N-acetylglucosamine 2-epimerase (non-hydrolyzing) [Gammaproteobacteria bacterium]|nr:MAG: UDP-N-acetylglucosamine 2-epimerase (non-hydrolyzing) [Gammaproteobacteria bacterium]UTW42481.1 UDP-N-acetylglucosamine 2-epimerase (non-hydrolyzing) [bacterium SCSIO 12844]
MNKIKVLSVFGTRPEAIKMAPVIKALEKDDQFQSIVCLTGQHRSMLDQMVALFELKVDYDLDIMQPNQTLSMITAKTVTLLEDILKKEKPHWLIVQGDTTSCFAAALTAFYNQINIAHVEAGLRTYNLSSPYPEEANRQLVSRIANLHFAPTPISQDNLLSEGVKKDHVTVTGNTVIDALLWIKNRISWQHSWSKLFKSATKIIQDKQPFIMITGHRRENHGEGFINICQAIHVLAKKYPNMHFIYPVHLNPNVIKPVFDLLSEIDNVHLIEPLDYEPFIYLMIHCYLVLTDSGGVQEEAPSLAKPVLVMRNTTERPEGVSAKTAKLVGTDKAHIVNEVSALIDDANLYSQMAQAVNPYGDGLASQRIIGQLKLYDTHLNKADK